MSSIAELLAASTLVRRDDLPGVAADGMRRVYLHAGHLHASAHPTQITTVVGSCVSIGMWDAQSGVGGMNHYMLGDDIGADVRNPRYANFAIRVLIERLVQLGATRDRLRAKVFGGGSVVSALQNRAHCLGTKNIQVGYLRLREAQIPIVADETGGQHGRKVVFSTHNGDSTTKRV